MPPSLNLLRRAENFGVLAFLFWQVCQNIIRRVLTRVLRKDFFLGKVFSFDLLSDFEEKFSDNCLKASQHAGQSCLFFVQKYILRTKYNFIRDNDVLFSSFRSFDISFLFFGKEAQQGCQNSILGVTLFFSKKFSKKLLVPIHFRSLSKKFTT